MMRYISVTAIAMTMAGCSILSPVKSDQPNSYVINKLPQHVDQSGRTNKIVLVTTPDVRTVFATKQIAYSTQKYRVGYFTRNQWAETPSQMLMPLIVQTLINTHHYKAVLTPPFGGKYDYILNTHIDQLQQNYTRVPALMQFTLRAELISTASNRVVATKEIVVTEPIRQVNPYNGVLAANKAVAEALDELADFCQDHS